MFDEATGFQIIFISNVFVMQCLLLCIRPRTTTSIMKVILEAENVGQASEFKFVEGALHQHWLPSPEVTVRSCLFWSDDEKPALGLRMLFVCLSHRAGSSQTETASFCILSDPRMSESEACLSLYLLLSSPKTLFNWASHQIKQIVWGKLKKSLKTINLNYCPVAGGVARD